MPKITTRKDERGPTSESQTRTDIFSPEKRSEIMSRVRHEDSGPELQVRSALHAAGFRFRLHRKDLPGTPDIVLPKYRLAIFVHGCFWHGHADCKHSVLPKTNTEFWKNKFERNKARDQMVRLELLKIGWHVLVIWECQIKLLTEIVNELKNCTSIKGSK